MPEIRVVADAPQTGVVEILKPRNNTHGVVISINTNKNNKDQLWFRHPANKASCNVDELIPAEERPAVFKFKNTKGAPMSRFTATVSQRHPEMSWLWRDIILFWLWDSTDDLLNKHM